MTETVAGSDAEAGTSLDDAGASVAGVRAAGSASGADGMLGASTQVGSSGGIQTEDFTLNFGGVEAEYFNPDRESTPGSVPAHYDLQELGESARDVDESDDEGAPDAVQSGDLAYRADNVVADQPESGPVQTRMTDTVAADDTKEATGEGDSGKGSSEPPVGTGPTGPLNASDAGSLDGGDSLVNDEAPLTLMDFKVVEDELPAVIEDSGANLGVEAPSDLDDLGADEDDAPPLE